jgi:thiol-disulfide isomerase/thioredoxin
MVRCALLFQTQPLLPIPLRISYTEMYTGAGSQPQILSAHCMKNSRVMHLTVIRLNSCTKYFKKLNTETMDFLKEHASEYFSLWYFGYQVVAPSSSMFKYDTAYLRGLVRYFKAVFPLKYQQSFEGKGMMQALEGRIKPPGVNDIAPDFSIADINSKKISLAKLKESTRFILLDFWASWCGPCLATIPVLKEMAANYTAENLTIIGISLDRDLRDLKKTVAAQKMTWPQIQDVEDDMSNKFGAFKIPAFVLIDNKGAIIFRGTGLEDKERLNAQLKKLVRPAKEIK